MKLFSPSNAVEVFEYVFIAGLLALVTMYLKLPTNKHK